MTILNDIIKLFKPNTGTKQETKKSEEDGLKPFTPQATYGQPVAPDMSITQQLGSYKSWVYVAVTKLAQCVADIELILYEKKSNGDVDVVERSDAIDTLEHVNNHLTFYDLVELYQTYMELTGEAFWWLIRNNKGEVTSIYPYLRPDRMYVIPDADKFIKGYVYIVPGSSEEVPFGTDEIIHFKMPNPNDPYRGYSAVKAGETTIMTDDSSSLWNWKFFENGAKPFGVLQSKNTISDVEYNRIITQWEQNHKSDRNAFRIAVLGGGIEYKDAGFTQKDMDFQSLKKSTRDEILALFKVPMGVISPDETVTYANAEASKSVFMEQVIVPKMRKFVNTLNEFYIPHFDKTGNLFYDFKDPVPKNKELQAKTSEVGIRSGYLTQNEVRKQMGYDPVEGGDTLYMPMNLVPTAETDGTKSEQNYMIKQKKRTKNDKLKDNLTKEIKNKFGDIIEPNRNDSWERKGEFVSMHRSAFVKKQSTALRQILRDFFLKQWLDRVLPGFKQSGAIEFDLINEITELQDLSHPVLKKTLKDAWDDSLKVIGKPEIFSDGYEDYASEIGLKFATTANMYTKEKLERVLLKSKEINDSKDIQEKKLEQVYNNAISKRSRTISRTEIQRMANWTTQRAYEDSDVVIAKQWYTALDERVCPYCGPLHGKIVDVEVNFFDKGEELPDPKEPSRVLKLDYDETKMPPLHANCRCTILPVTKKLI